MRRASPPSSRTRSHASIASWRAARLREEALSSNGAPAPTKAMKPVAAASPEEAMALRAVHGEAMKEMQGN